MSTLLLPELAQENATFNRRVALAVEAEAQHLEKLRQLQERLLTLRRRMTSSTREALRCTLAQAAEAHGLWQGTLALFEDGLEGVEAREVLQVVLEVFDSWFSLVKSTRGLWHTAEQAGTTPEGLDTVDEASRDIQALRVAAEELRAFLTRPQPSVDPALLEKARQAVAQGRYKTPEAVRADGRQLLVRQR